MKFQQIFIVLFCFQGISCGYHLAGTAMNLPKDAKTIVFLKFQNESNFIEAEQFVRVSLRDELISRSHLMEINPIEKADLVLEGTIVAFKTNLPSSEHIQFSNVYKIEIVVNLKLLDKKNNNIVFTIDSLSFVDTYEAKNGDFFVQETDSTNKVARRFAKFAISAIIDNY